MRPPIDRPPSASRSGATPARSTSARRGGPDRVEEHRRPVRRLAAGQPVGEVHALDRQRRDRRLDGHERRALRAGAGAGRQQQRADTGRLRSSSGHQDDPPQPRSRMRRASPRSTMALLAAISSPPWSGCTCMRRVRNWARTSRLTGPTVPGREAEHVERPRHRIDEGRERAGPRSALPARWAMSAGPIGPRQRIALCSTPAIAWRASGAEPLGGVDRAEDLLQRRAVVLEVEADRPRPRRSAGGCCGPGRGGRPGSGGAGGAARPAGPARSR